MLLIMTKISNSSRFYDLPLLPTSSLSNPDCFYSQCSVHLNSALITASPLWSSALVQLSYIVCSCACHVLLPPVTYTMPRTQLITALTYFTILFASSNYYWSQLRVYWGEPTGLSEACHFLNMHSAKVCISHSECSWVTLKCSLWCPQPVSSSWG